MRSPKNARENDHDLRVPHDAAYSNRNSLPQAHRLMRVAGETQDNIRAQVRALILRTVQGAVRGISGARAKQVWRPSLRDWSALGHCRLLQRAPQQTDHAQSLPTSWDRHCLCVLPRLQHWHLHHHYHCTRCQCQGRGFRDQTLMLIWHLAFPQVREIQRTCSGWLQHASGPRRHFSGASA